MAYFKVTRFSGIAPGVAPRLLSDIFSQTAENIDFESGRLTPITDPSNAGTLSGGTRQSLYYYENDTYSRFLEWNQADVHVAKGPIAQDPDDRLYWSGQDYPRMSSLTSIQENSSAPGLVVNSFRLGVPAPASAPTVALGGDTDEDAIPNDVSYVYTYVSHFGEEGPPSPASSIITMTDTNTGDLSGMVAPAGSPRAMSAGSLIRVYRSNTGSTNTQFQFVDEDPISDMVSNGYTDSTDAALLGELLPSATWIGPPDDDSSTYPDGPMEWLIPVANGVFAGFSGNRLCFSEPYLPHAWPVQFRITIENNIVAIGATGNGVICLTDGAPYLITGVGPGAMVAVRIDSSQACLNAQSVVDMGEYILYASPDGLVAVSGNQAEVITKGLISPTQWITDFRPAAIRAFQYEGTYVAFWTVGSDHGGWVFDPRSENAAISTLSSSAEVRGGWSNMKDGELYTIVGNLIKKWRASGTKRDLTWKTKKFVTPSPISMGWVSVHADTYTDLIIKVYGDGTLIAHYELDFANDVYTQTTTVPSNIDLATLREPVMRLPATVAQEWEIQVSGDVDINEICIAQSIEEIRSV